MIRLVTIDVSPSAFGALSMSIAFSFAQPATHLNAKYVLDGAKAIVSILEQVNPLSDVWHESPQA